MYRKSLEEAIFCAVDVETSGLYLNSRMVEIGAARIGPEGEIVEFSVLVNPRERISSGATAIHGITDEMVEGCPFPEEAVIRLREFLGDAVFIAHNARFDVRVIGMELARAGIDPPDNPVLDTVLLARKMFYGLPNYRLATLVEHLGIQTGRLHRGLPDALAALEVFQRYLREASPGYPLGDAPGLLGTFSELAPRIEPVPEGEEPDLYELAGLKAMAEMIYQGGSRPGEPRMVTPLHVFPRGGREFLRAYCHRDGVEKTFKVELIQSIWLVR